MRTVAQWDVIIVGGGPAGLSAALVLGRCRRRVLVCDDGHPRNEVARSSHGFLTRDGAPPQELLRTARAQLQPYGVVVKDLQVVRVSPVDGSFDVELASGRVERARKVLLATGVKDRLPDIAGAEALYGKGVFHCPYCDGWEVREKPLAALGQGEVGYELAIGLRTWSAQVSLLTDGAPRLRRDQLAKLARYGIPVRVEPVLRLDAKHGRLHRVFFRRGPPLPCAALFFTPTYSQRSALPEQLGCVMTKKGCVKPGKLEETNIPGLYVAGDASRDVQFLIVAAAEGARAAVGINKALREEDFPS